MRIRRAPALAAALAALLLSGCAGDGGTDGTDEPGATPTTTPTAVPTELEPSLPLPTHRPSPKPTGPLDPSLPGEPGADLRTATGRVVSGVEPGCLLLRGEGAEYLLIFRNGGREKVRENAVVTVVGSPQPDLVTTCQQGVPFLVTEVQPG